MSVDKKYGSFLGYGPQSGVCFLLLFYTFYPPPLFSFLDCSFLCGKEDEAE